MLHHHQRIALVAQTLQGTQQYLVVTRMQANGRLVQHVAHALQIAAQLRGQANALRLTTAECGCATVQRQVAQAHLLQEFQAALDLGDQIACDIVFALAQTAHGLQGFNPLTNVCHAQTRQRCDGSPIHRSRGAYSPMRLSRKLGAEPHRTRSCVQPCALAGGASCIVQVFNIGLCKGLLAALVVIVFDGVVKHLALLFGQRHSRAHTIRAPAVLAVVREQTWVQLGIRGGAHRAGALGREHLQLANARSGCAGHHGLAQALNITQHIHQPLAMGERIGQRLA